MISVQIMATGLNGTPRTCGSKNQMLLETNNSETCLISVYENDSIVQILIPGKF